MTWDEYCERYLTERKTNLEYLWKEISPCVYHLSNEDIQWLIQALEDEQRQWFVAFIVKKASGGLPKRLKRVLFSPLIRAAVYERNPSLNRYFVEPCVAVFGYRQVNEALLDLVEQGSNFEKAGAVNALYWARFRFSFIKSAPEYTLEYATPESKAAYEALADIRLRKQCLFLREFVSNPNLDVRRSIISNLVLNPSCYADELKPLVLNAIEIARVHSDDYIRHRVEVQLGTKCLLKPLPHREPNSES
jgi:hypothetical protein